MRFYAELLRNLFSPLPYAVAKYRSSAMEQTIDRLVERETPDLVVCDFLAPSVNVPGDLPVATVLFQHNVEAMIWRRHAAVATSRWRRAYLERQWQRMHAYGVGGAVKNGCAQRGEITKARLREVTEDDILRPTAPADLQTEMTEAEGPEIVGPPRTSPSDRQPYSS